MNYIEVNRWKQVSETYAETVVTQMIITLMPRMKTLEITVNIKN